MMQRLLPDAVLHRRRRKRERGTSRRCMPLPALRHLCPRLCACTPTQCTAVPRAYASIGFQPCTRVPSGMWKRK